MTQPEVHVEEWMAMFKEIGLNENQMMTWHQLFETRHPAAHQSFLEWLGLPSQKIEEIRRRSR